MLKNVSGVAFQVGENVYHFLCSQNGTFVEIKEALSQFMAHIVNLEAQANAQAAAKAQQAAAQESQSTTE